MSDLYYVEADGGVFPLKKDGKYVLARSLDEIPFKVSRESMGELENGGKLWFCVPETFTFDSSWPCKDDLILEDAVEKNLRAAIIRSRVNVFANAIIPSQDQESVLLVLQGRGFAQGLATPPGGYVKYGESPEQGVVRETVEETGLQVVVKQQLGFYTRCCEKTGRFSYGVPYLCEIVGGDLRCKEGEILSAEYIPVAKLNGQFMMTVEEVGADGKKIKKLVETRTNNFSKFAVEEWLELRNLL